MYSRYKATAHNNGHRTTNNGHAPSACVYSTLLLLTSPVTSHAIMVLGVISVPSLHMRYATGCARAVRCVTSLSTAKKENTERWARAAVSRHDVKIHINIYMSTLHAYIFGGTLQPSHLSTKKNTMGTNRTALYAATHRELKSDTPANPL